MLIGEFQKNTMEKLRVAVENYKGHDFVDIRIYYEDEYGQWKPTRKGVTIAPEKIDELIDLLKEAKRSM